MEEGLNLVRDLAVILISAGIFTIISKALKQPTVLGYIIAGFLIGPNIGFFPGISSTEAVQQWSDLGIIFLMFGLGLEFSFKKLLKVGSGALVTAGCKFIGVFFIGFVIGRALGWTTMESVFLAGLLSMSSTAVVVKSYEDMGLKEKPYATLVFGTLVVEDLIAILLMVLLSTMAVSNRFAGGEMLFNLAKLVFFLILWFLVGIYVIPTILKRAKKYITDEILLLVGVGLCFGMVTMAQSVGFSSALGAFVMGSILAETIEGEHISRLISPIKDLFSAIFFVSVGMMVSPSVIAEHWLVILILVLTVMVTHIVFAGIGVILNGKGLENAVHTGFSLAQLGEFGFIIAGVGINLGVMRSFIYPVIIAVSVITTFTTPYMIRLGGPALKFLQDKLPKWLLERIAQAENTGEGSEAEHSEWVKLLKAYFLRILLYGVIILAIDLGAKAYLEPLAAKLFTNLGVTAKNIITTATTLALMSPFIYGLGVSSGSINKSARRLLEQKSSNRWPVLGLTLARIFLAISVIVFVIAGHFDLAGWTILLILFGGLVFFLIARVSMRRNYALEQRFLRNFNEKESEPVELKPGFEIRTLVLKDNSFLTGKTLRNSGLKDFGCVLVSVKHNGEFINNPAPDFQFEKGDTVWISGEKSSVDLLK